MSSDAALLSLSATTSGLQSQIDDLKQDKRDLRLDKESLKTEVAGLKEELRSTLGDVSRLKAELQDASMAVERWKSQCEAERSGREPEAAVDQASHQTAVVAVRYPLSQASLCSADLIRRRASLSPTTSTRKQPRQRHRRISPPRRSSSPRMCHALFKPPAETQAKAS